MNDASTVWEEETLPAKPKKLPRAATAEIDRARLRTALRALDREVLLLMLDHATEWLEPDQLVAMVTPYVTAKAMAPAPDLLADIEGFVRRSRDGEYYESFRVNSRNCTLKSRSTETWIAECDRLLARCAVEAPNTDPARLRTAIAAMFDLLRAVDACNDDIVFWADEGGLWGVGVDWKGIAPAWFGSLAATCDPEAFADEVSGMLRDLVPRYEQVKVLALARAAASPDQCRALDARLEARP